MAIPMAGDEPLSELSVFLRPFGMMVVFRHDGGLSAEQEDAR